MPDENHVNRTSQLRPTRINGIVPTFFHTSSATAGSLALAFAGPEPLFREVTDRMDDLDHTAPAVREHLAATVETLP